MLTVRQRVPDAQLRHILAQTAFQPELQQALAEAAASVSKSVSEKLRRDALPGDRILIDAEAVAQNGAIVAEIGMPAEPDGMASNIKSEDYGLAFDLGILHSVDDPVPGTRLPVWKAVARSDQNAAMALASRIGIPRLADFLRSQGYLVTGDYQGIAMGSGVTGSPRLMAGNFLKFSYSAPGYRIYPEWAPRLVDGNTGQELYAAAPLRVFGEKAATLARRAFEFVSLSGTGAPALRTLALQAPIAAKTGTVGFYRGHGGSLCVATDSATGLTAAVRVRWRSGHPLQIDGGHSAAFVITKFLADARVIHQGGTAR
jgi:hypothetical protein